jgi:uncharacterized protein (DUF1800 family)
MMLSNRILAVVAFVLLSAVQSGAAVAAKAATLGYDDARHLLNRVGFGATPAEIGRYAGMTRNEAVDALLTNTPVVAQTPPPAWTAEPMVLRYPPRDTEAADAQRKMFVQEQTREGLELRGWWIDVMLTTPSPLTERMTLFWHNHFVSSQQKVRFATLMYRQNALLRANALGNFSTMLHAAARDPAMLIYLDTVRNRRGAANENFAREVMELFTLGEGHYSERDVKEAARAFTGWSLDRETGEFVFRPMLHDYGVKTVLGQSGNFDGDDVLDILLAQPETAEFVTRKLWREFVAPNPDEAEVARIAKLFRESHYDIKVALEKVLTSDAFYSPANRGVLVKSPVELVVGTLRQFGLTPANATPFAIAAAAMGQNLFSPPNVKGWPGQEAWINSSTLLARKQFLARVFRSDDLDIGNAPGASAPASMTATDAMPSAQQANNDAERARQIRAARAIERGITSVRFDPAAWTAQLDTPRPAKSHRDAAVRLLLAVAPQTAPDANSDTLTLVRGLALDAAYQLK